MKKIISTYLIFAFMLMTFSGCGRIKNSLGLSSANVENPESPENSNKAENPTPIYAVEQLTQQEEPPSVLQDQLNRIKRSMGGIFKLSYIVGSVVFALVGACAY